MPLVEVTAPQGTLNKKDQDTLMSRLSDAVLKAEHAPVDDPAAQSLVWAYFNEVPEGASYVGGKSLEKAPMRIAVTTPEGALNDGTRRSLVEEIGAIVDDLVGPFEGRLNHWAMLYELDEGGWAGGGQIFRLADIQAAMNVSVA
jgi:phenylpyruvate tautomerase PptA (4-oxalocrotonate tautomerase family)